MPSKSKRNKIAFIIAIIAGLFLIVSGVTGGTGIWGYILNLIVTLIGGEVAIIASYVLLALAILANLGGITVILGGIMFYIGHITTGRFLSSIGAGMGIFGFIILYLLAFYGGWAYLITITAQLINTIGGLGILLSIISSVIAKKD
jgi:hypothetical protein